MSLQGRWFHGIHIQLPYCGWTANQYLVAEVLVFLRDDKAMMNKMAPLKLLLPHWNSSESLTRNERMLSMSPRPEFKQVPEGSIINWGFEFQKVNSKSLEIIWPTLKWINYLYTILLFILNLKLFFIVKLYKYKSLKWTRKLFEATPINWDFEFHKH